MKDDQAKLQNTQGYRQKQKKDQRLHPKNIS